MALVTLTMQIDAGDQEEYDTVSATLAKNPALDVTRDAAAKRLTVVFVETHPASDWG
jgi:hypothetical protein